MRKSKKVIFIGGVACLVVLALAASLAVSAMAGYIFMLVWNGFVAPAADWPELSFWYAWGISFLVAAVGRTLSVRIIERRW